MTSSPSSALPAGQALKDRQLFLCQDTRAIHQGDKQQPEGRVGGRSCLGEITGGHSEGVKRLRSSPSGHPGPAPVPAHLLTSLKSLVTLEQGARLPLGMESASPHMLCPGICLTILEGETEAQRSV